MKNFFIKCDQIHSFQLIWSHLLEKSLIENFIFCAVIAIKVFAMVNTFVSTMANSSLTEKGDEHLKKQVS